MPEKINVWKDEYKIRSYDTDFCKNISITSLCKFLQESASNHAAHLTLGFDDLIKEDKIWVLSRFAIKVLEYPQLGDEISVQTWPSGIESLFALRDFEITKNCTIGFAKSAWLILDIKTRKPQRLDSILEKRISYPDKKPFIEKIEKIQALSKVDESFSYSVKFSDIDIHKHVNNVKYIEWILNSYSFDFYKENKVSSLEINYINETFFGEEVIIQTQKNSETEYLHSIINQSNANKELCRVKIIWEKIVDFSHAGSVNLDRRLDNVNLRDFANE